MGGHPNGLIVTTVETMEPWLEPSGFQPWDPIVTPPPSRKGHNGNRGLSGNTSPGSLPWPPLTGSISPPPSSAGSGPVAAQGAAGEEAGTGLAADRVTARVEPHRHPAPHAHRALGGGPVPGNPSMRIKPGYRTLPGTSSPL